MDRFFNQLKQLFLFAWNSTFTGAEQPNNLTGNLKIAVEQPNWFVYFSDRENEMQSNFAHVRVVFFPLWIDKLPGLLQITEPFSY
jgi:hypothetical protein